MAIKIDDMAYSDNCNDELLFEYLYHLSVMLAYKAKYFKTSNQYDDFGLFLASSTFFRLKNPKQFILDDNGKPVMNQIKSILNYLKKVLYPRKVAFEQETYAQTEIELNEENIGLFPGYTFADKLSDSVDKIMKVEFQVCLGEIDKSIRNFLKSIPYRYKSVEWYNIYISVMLSFLNSFLLSKRERDQLENAKYKISDHNRILEMYEHKNMNFVVLFNLDTSMKQYIYILVKLIKKSIADDLSFMLHSEVNSSRLSMPMLKKELNCYYEE